MNVDLVFFPGIVSVSSDGLSLLVAVRPCLPGLLVPAEDLNSDSEVGPDDGPHLNSPREDALGDLLWCSVGCLGITSNMPKRSPPTLR